MMLAEPPAFAAPSRPKRLGHVWAALGLLAVVLAGHGVSLWDGLFFDDHWHRAVSRRHGWGFSDLIDSATVDLSGRLRYVGQRCCRLCLSGRGHGHRNENSEPGDGRESFAHGSISLVPLARMKRSPAT